MIFSGFAKKILKILPPPPALTFDCAGIEISTEAVRLVKLKNTKFGKVPHIIKEIKFKNVCPVLQKDEDLDSCTELKSVLNNLRIEFDLNYVICSLPESQTYIFKTILPNEAKDHIRDTLLYKLEENVPLDPNDVLFDYSVSPGSLKGDNFEVIVTALPKEVVDFYIRLLESCNLTPISFESESQALARSLILQKDFSPYMILNITDQKVHVSVADEGLVQYTSSLPVTAKEIISDLNGMPARHLIENINRLLVYWFTTMKHPDDPQKIQAVILTGEYASNNELVKFIADHCNVQVTIGNVWANCFSLDDYIPEIKKEDSNKFSLAVGLSLTKV